MNSFTPLAHGMHTVHCTLYDPSARKKLLVMLAQLPVTAFSYKLSVPTTGIITARGELARLPVDPK
jgi:hypothetical protein